MKILIIAVDEDTHLDAVQWGLRQLGHEPVVWYWENFPRYDYSTLAIGPMQQARLTLTIDGTVHCAPFDVVWDRRRGKPQPRTDCHPQDAAVVRTESILHIQSSLRFLGDENTLWVNDLAADQFCDHKANQLLAAQRVGFRIPDTLIGNNPEQIQAFFRKHHGKIIYKAFYPARWTNEDGSTTILKTAEITASHVADSDVLAACPGIYQQLIEKDLELRVTVIGDDVLASAIYSQENGRSIDWRYDGPVEGFRIEAFTLPEALRRQCLSLCRELHLAYGCIDIVIDQTGEAVFLEINHAGQFLWNERLVPDMPLLDTFCRFLCRQESRASGPRLRYSDFRRTNAHPNRNCATPSHA